MEKKVVPNYDAQLIFVPNFDHKPNFVPHFDGSVIFAQVDDSGLRKRADPAGKTPESHRILPANFENQWKMEAAFRPEFFGLFPVNFRPFSSGMH
jgi:hypothetical protein